ncbi:PhoH-like phosphate starvation-inducible [Vibrio phage 184E37-3b]|nr:hypothetical protein MYOV056v2_p0159 [Vibrio phage 184E37.3a]
MAKRRHNNRNTQQDRSGKGKVKHLGNDKNLGGGSVIKEKFKERREFELPPVTAKTPKQKEYLKLLKDCNIVVVEGLFGTGKTFLAACQAGDALRKGEVEKVIVARPYVQTGKTSGFKPGSSLEKLFPYVRNVLDTMRSRMGDGAFGIALKDGISGSIEVQEVESIRGRSFDQPSFLIIDEAQQTTLEEMESIVTRISDNCTLILCGDDSQRDIRGTSGLRWFKEFAERHHLDGVGFVNFDSPDDIVRGGMVRDIAIGLAKDKGQL